MKGNLKIQNVKYYISKNLDSNRYNVLNACLALIAKVETLLEKVK